MVKLLVELVSSLEHIDRFIELTHDLLAIPLDLSPDALLFHAEHLLSYDDSKVDGQQNDRDSYKGPSEFAILLRQQPSLSEDYQVVTDEQEENLVYEFHVTREWPIKQWEMLYVYEVHDCHNNLKLDLHSWVVDQKECDRSKCCSSQEEHDRIRHRNCSNWLYCLIH